jgi:hypothetical protein
MCAVPMPGYKTESWVVAGVVIGIFILTEKFVTKSEDCLW